MKRLTLEDLGFLARTQNELWNQSGLVPSLDLQFANLKNFTNVTTGTSPVTFSRASRGTYVGSDGMIKTATTNLLLGSEEINNATYWNHIRVTPSPNAAIAPNGTQTADFVAPTVDNNTHYVAQLLSTPANTTYVSSFFVKAAGYSQAFIRFAGNGWDVRGTFAYIDLNTGNVTGSNAQFLNVQQYPNGWWRIWHTIATDATSSTSRGVLLALGDNGSILFTGDPTKGIYIWGAQLEQSSTIGEYIPTTSTINSAPRFDHDPTTGESLGLLIEEQRTNLLLQSAASNLSPWQRIQAAVTPDVSGVIAPDGTQTADFLAENTATSEHYDQQSVEVTAGTTYVYSRFYKGTGAGNRIVWHRIAGAAIGGFTFNPDTLYGISGASFVEHYPNGWIRVSTVFTPASTGNAILRAQIREGSISPGVHNYTGDGASGFYTWGAQLEVASFPTSYIPTTTSAVTRAADVASITGANFSSWYNQSEGTLFAEASISNNESNRFIAALSDATIGNEVALYWSTIFSSLVVATSVAQANSFGGTVTAGASNKHSFGYKINDFQGYGNAIALTTDTNGTVPTVDRLTFGSRVNSTFFANGTIRRITYWPVRLPNEVLQQITQ